MPRADFVQQFLLPRVAGPFTVCPELMSDRSPVTARVDVPSIIDGSSGPALAPIGVSVTSSGSSVVLCVGAAEGSSMGDKALRAILGRTALDPAPASGGAEPGGVLGLPQLGRPGSAIAPVGGFAVQPAGLGAPPPSPPARPTELHVYRLAAAEPSVVAKTLAPMCARVACAISAVEGQPEVLALMQEGQWPDVKRALAEVDQEPRSYMVRGLVFEADDTVASQIGVSFDLGRNAFLSTTSAATSQETQVGLSFAGASLAVNAQADKGRATVLSKPTLRVLDGQPASFESSTSEPVVSQVVRDPTGLTTQGVTYMDAGVILGVTVTASGSLARVTLKEELSSFGSTAGVAGDPTKTKRVISATFVVPFGRPLLLGGLTRSTTDRAESRLPFVGLLTGKTNTADSERVYMLLQLDQEPAELGRPGDGARKGDDPDDTAGRAPGGRGGPLG